jgi:hypothetical protein
MTVGIKLVVGLSMLFVLAFIAIFIYKVTTAYNIKKKEEFIRRAADDICKPGKHYVFYGNGNGNPFDETKHEYIILETIDDWVKYKEIDTAPNGKQTYADTTSCLKVSLYKILTSKCAKNTVYYDTI